MGAVCCGHSGPALSSSSAQSLAWGLSQVEEEVKGDRESADWQDYPLGTGAEQTVWRKVAFHAEAEPQSWSWLQHSRTIDAALVSPEPPRGTPRTAF